MEDDHQLDRERDRGEENQQHGESSRLVETQQPLQQAWPHHAHTFFQPEQPIYGYPLDSAYGHQVHMSFPQPVYGYQYPLQHMEGVPLPPGIPGIGGSTDPLEAVLGPFPCVRLRNLPYDTSLEAVLVFFQGLVLIDVVLMGQGEAFVIFANPMDFQMALQRNRQTIGRRFVDIATASRSEYYEAVAAQHENEKGTHVGSAGGVLPSVGGIRQRSDGGVGMGDDTPQSNEALLWSNEMQAHTFEGMGQHHHSAAAMMTGLNPGTGIGRLGPSPPRMHPPLQKRTGGGIQVGEHTGYLRMRGLPFSATKDDIYKFFVGYNPVPESIVLTYRNDGRATGEAYVGFASPNDSEHAMELHRRSMGNRYIELFISNKEEQGRALARFGNR